MEVPLYINGSVQDCGNSIALAVELPQSCTMQLIYYENMLCNCMATGERNDITYCTK